MNYINFIRLIKRLIVNVEEKYKLFGLDNEKINNFRGYSERFATNQDNLSSFAVKTLVIERFGNNFEVKEKNDAKLV